MQGLADITSLDLCKDNVADLTFEENGLHSMQSLWADQHLPITTVSIHASNVNPHLCSRCPCRDITFYHSWGSLQTE